MLLIFFARVAFFMCSTAFLLFRTAVGSHRVIDRFAPIAVLVALAVFSSRFVVKVSPEVRAHLVRSARHGLIGAAALTDLLAAATVVAGDLVPDKFRMAGAVTALMLALCSALLLLIDSFRRFPELARPLVRWRAILRRAVIGLSATGVLLAAVGFLTSGIGPLLAGLIALAVGGVLAFALRRSSA